MFVNKDELRRLANKKASRPIMGQGIPAPNEGTDGDFRLYNSPSGIKLYAKFAGQWFGFSPDDDGGVTDSITARRFWALHGGIHDGVSGTGNTFWCINDYSGRSVASPPAYADFEACAFVAPFSGSVLSITYRSRTAGAATDLKIYKLVDGEGDSPDLVDDLLESQTINSAANTASSADYVKSSFEKGEVLFFSSDPTDDPSEVLYSILFEINDL